jgi:UDP-GlcNAc:undecaprenyl-phosphate GlcNAc-1-phosphate transferase
VLGGLSSMLWKNEVLAVVPVAVTISFLVATKLFGHAELVLLAKRVRYVFVSSMKKATPSQPHHLEVHLQGLADWRWLWTELVKLAPQLNLAYLQFDVNAPASHESYHASMICSADDMDEFSTWRAQIPVQINQQFVGRLEIRGRRDRKGIGEKIGAILHQVERFEARTLLSLPTNGHLKPAPPEHVSVV